MKLPNRQQGVPWDLDVQERGHVVGEHLEMRLITLEAIRPGIIFRINYVYARLGSNTEWLHGTSKKMRGH